MLHPEHAHKVIKTEASGNQEIEKYCTPHGKPYEIDWGKLRDEYFKECVTKVDGMAKVNMAPHDLFRWFEKKIKG